MENSFLTEFKKRDYFNQCTNFDELEKLMNENKFKEYIAITLLTICLLYLMLNATH